MNQDRGLPPIRWHPSGVHDLKLEDEREKSLRSVWYLDDKLQLNPARVARNVTIYEDFLDANSPEDAQDVPDFQKGGSTNKFEQWEMLTPNFRVKPKGTEWKDKQDKLVSHCYEPHTSGSASGVASLPNRAGGSSSDEGTQKKKASKKSGTKKGENKKRPLSTGQRQSSRKKQQPTKYGYS